MYCADELKIPLCLESNQSWRGLSASCPIHIAMLLLTWTEIVLPVNTYSNLLHEQCVIYPLPDLFLVCDEDNGRDHYYQIWTNKKDDGFELAQTGRFPAGFQSVTFGDIGNTIATG